MPDSARDAAAPAFSDQGAWHMFGLPDPELGEALGGFTGPLLLTDGGLWVGRSLAGFRVWMDGEDEPVPWQAGTGSGVAAYPGRLVQHLVSGSLRADVELSFVSERSALIRATLTQEGPGAASFSVGWGGDAGLSTAAMVPSGAGAQVEVEGSSTVVDLATEGAEQSSLFVGPQGAYSLRGSPRTLEAGSSVTRHLLVSVYGSRAELDGDAARREAILAEGALWSARQKERWGRYLSAVLGRLAGETPAEHRRIAVKSVETLLSNWRSPLGDLRHAGLFPSWAYRGFHGVWSWDSWKHARALALFEPGLAEDQVRAMLDWQDPEGMVPDVIYADSSENNWRDTKPPLAAWAVAGIFDATGDTAFVAEVYPALAAYHGWWSANRDHDGDGLCEYGSTDGTRIAAAWESGMDNAVRFDSATMVMSHEGAWSLNQESVDLNAYLYAEKGYLAGMADLLGRPDEADAYRRDAGLLARRIRDVMWDEESGYFYDVEMDSGRPVRVQGPEGWIPLWAGVATPEQARRVAAVMMDPARFAATVPLPTLSMARPEFDPADGYWRGPVWLDQAYFGVRGLERYGLTAEAGELRARLLEGPRGLTGDAPIFENYDPRSGEGLNAPHFSWSAAHLLMLLDVRDGERP